MCSMSLVEIYNQSINYPLNDVQYLINQYIKLTNNFELIEALSVLNVACEQKPRKMFNNISDYINEENYKKYFTKADAKLRGSFHFSWKMPNWDEKDFEDIVSSSSSEYTSSEYSEPKTNIKLPNNEYKITHLENENYKLTQMSFCFTGNLQEFGRDQVYKFIKDNDGIVHKNLKRSTDYLVVADEPGKTKLNMAKKYDTLILTEEEFYLLLENYKFKMGSGMSFKQELMEFFRQKTIRQNNYKRVLEQLEFLGYELL